MTKTPLDELRDALEAAFSAEVAFHLIELAPLPRADIVKAIWSQEVLSMPPGGLDGGPGPIMSYPDPHDPNGDRLVFEIIDYGGKKVVECEGVVVCHLFV